MVDTRFNQITETKVHSFPFIRISRLKFGKSYEYFTEE